MFVKGISIQMPTKLQQLQFYLASLAYPESNFSGEIIRHYKRNAFCESSCFFRKYDTCPFVAWKTYACSVNYD